MTIHIEELHFDTIIGILDFERITPQTVIVDARIDYHYEDEMFINYADVILLIEKEMNEKKYELLETAIFDLQNLVTTKYKNIENFYLKITKPNIIKNAKVALSFTWKK
jgi:dihydroneopterin aldolase